VGVAGGGLAGGGRGAALGGISLPLLALLAQNPQILQALGLSSGEQQPPAATATDSVPEPEPTPPGTVPAPEATAPQIENEFARQEALNSQAGLIPR